MLNDFQRVPDHQPVSEAELVHRINLALAGKGLQVKSAGPTAPAKSEGTRYNLVNGARRFPLRTAIEEFARALGILSQPSQAEVHVHARNRPCVCELRQTQFPR